MYLRIVDSFLRENEGTEAGNGKGSGSVCLVDFHIRVEELFYFAIFQIMKDAEELRIDGLRDRNGDADRNL